MLNFVEHEMMLCHFLYRKIHLCSFLKEKFLSYVNFSDIPIENNTKNKEVKIVLMRISQFTILNSVENESV